MTSHAPSVLPAAQANATQSTADDINAERKLTLGLILPAVLVPCTLMILLVAVISFGMVFFRSETDRLGRACAPGVSKDTTLAVTDIQASVTSIALLQQPSRL
jgi:hypothetical protein